MDIKHYARNLVNPIFQSSGNLIQQKKKRKFTLFYITSQHKSMSDEFTRHIFEIIIAKVAQAKGFTTISETALNILVEVAIERISQCARSAAQITTHCGRTDTNGYDVFAALSKFHENPETLASYINTCDSMPPFEFLVEPYPLPRLSRFYTTSNQSNQTNNNILPFRANTCFYSDTKSRSIPPFFPPTPSRYTYDQTVQPDPMVDDQEMMKKHESDQNQIQQSLAQILAGRGTDQPHAVHFDSELTRLASNAIISKPTDMIDSPIYQIEGIRPDVDPEFLPLIEVTETTFANESQNIRDIQNMSAILAIPQGTTEPGTIKKSALYMQNSTPEKTPEKPSSPASS
ncbi:hypothetical protein TRFO_25694 [Tritrichomonas foetus]|uniref:Transcription initiation factor TFIID subunit 8 n=1 Tax=Tritrichomonas foetus TaxID=1144522 RepID=A0A1J4K9B5_9EUKA|nr:hypothetical protein TRFO_25694 [Tritrichomonas foetus]|eukprot:OHT06284.1 hypothetical protein TRFO_25694 [Tritrichomonas foetus]